MILLSDGQSFGSNWDALLAQYRASGVTLSTIGIGQDIDTNLMSLLARGGLGRYDFTDRVREIPRIMLRETNVVTRPVAMEGRDSRGWAPPARCCARCRRASYPR